MAGGRGAKEAHIAVLRLVQLRLVRCALLLAGTERVQAAPPPTLESHVQAFYFRCILNPE